MQDHLNLHGILIPDDSQIITDRVRRSISAGRYERDEMTGLPKFIEPSDRVVELGAGIGFISSFVTKRLGVRQALCIEANPTLCDFIGRVHAANGIQDVDVVNAVAVSEAQSGETSSFYVREPFWSSSMDSKPEYERVVDVPQVSLPDVLRDMDANTLIVDIEGGEKGLFEGMDLVNVTKVYLEVHTRKIGLRGIKNCFDSLSALGFVYDQRVSCGGSVLFRRMRGR